MTRKSAGESKHKHYLKWLMLGVHFGDNALHVPTVERLGGDLLFAYSAGRPPGRLWTQELFWAVESAPPQSFWDTT